MMPTSEADDASWPPTLTPEAVVRTRFAWCTMLVASQRTRRCTASSTSSDVGTGWETAARCSGIAGEFKANGVRHEHDVRSDARDTQLSDAVGAFWVRFLRGDPLWRARARRDGS